jgi:DNA-binding NarL/FixJ family response regulator
LTSGYKFVVADDHPLFRGALKEALVGMAEGSVVIEAGDFESVKSLIAANDDADLVLLDLTMPGASGLSGLVALRGLHSSMPMIVVSAHDDPETIRRALELGASGFIPKSASMEEIRAAVSTVLSGDIYTPEGIDLGVEADP